MDTVTQIVVILVVILFSMTLHEVMHGFVAYWLGDDTAKLQGRLTLNPTKHIDPFLTILLPVFLALTGGPIFGGAKPVPFNPNRVKYDEWGVALVALAGPLTNFVIAFVIFGIYSVIGGTGFLPQALLLAVYVNLGFMIFNLIPIPPLDGSRVLYALAPDFVRSGMQAVERFGIILVFAIVLLGGPLLSQFLLGSLSAIIGLFTHIFAV